MTTYTTLSNSTVDTDKPANKSLLRALRDNPLAIAEGDVTAPSIMTSALEVAVGDVISYADDILSTINSTTFTSVKTVIVPFKGAYRISFNLVNASGNTSFAVLGRPYLNGVAVGTEVTTNSSIASTQDITGVTAGSTLEIRTRSIASGISSGISQFRIKLSTGVGYVKL